MALAFVRSPKKIAKNFPFISVYLQKATENTLSLIDRLGNTLLSTKAVGEEPSSLNTSTLLMILDRQKPAIMGNRTLRTQQKKRVILPSSETLFANDNFSSSYVDAQVSEWYAMFNTILLA